MILIHTVSLIVALAVPLMYCVNMLLIMLVYFLPLCRLDENSVIKVGDFGLSEDIYSQNYYRQNFKSCVKLPIKWMALESLQNGIFTEKTDVVSMGVAIGLNVYMYN